MALDPVFGEAWINRLSPRYQPSNPWSAHRVLGRRLRPFSLWHRLLLRSIDSPFMAPGAPVSAADLDRAVSVCRCRYEETDFSARGNLRLLWRVAAGGLARETSAFLQYLGDFHAPADYRSVPTEGGKEGPPPLPRGRPESELSDASAIISWSHWPEAHVWEMPVGKASWYAAMAQESSGAQLDFTDEKRRQYEAGLEAREKDENPPLNDEEDNDDGHRS